MFLKSNCAINDQEAWHIYASPVLNELSLYVGMSKEILTHWPLEDMVIILKAHF